VCKEGETDIQETDEGSHDVTNVDSFVVIAFGDVQLWSWDTLLPSKAHVGGKDNHCRAIEQRPSKRFEELELETVDVPHFNHFIALRNPEQSQMQNTLDVDQIWRRAQGEWSCYTEAELEQVNCHESQKAQARDCKIQLPRNNSVVDGDVPRAFEGNGNMQKRSKGNIDLHNVGWKAKSSPVESDIEITIAVEVIWAQEDVHVSNCVDDDEDKKPHC